MIQIPGLLPDEEDPLAPMQAPQLDAPTMSLSTRAPLQATQGNTGGGGGSDMPPPPPSVPGIAIMQPPERSDKSEHKGEQVNQTFTQISPEAANDIGQLGAAHAAARQARAEQAKARDPVAEANALGAEKQAIALQLAEARKQEAIAKAEPQIKAAMAADHQATKEMEANRKFTDYWEDKGTPAKLFAALLVGLNQYAVTGRGMGGHNMAWDIFQNAAAADRQRKLDKFNASKDMSELRRRDVGAANQALTGKLAQLDNEAVAMGKAYAAQTKAYAERLGKPAALAAAAETDAKADALEAETRLKQRKDYEKKFTVEGERDDSGHTLNTVKVPPGGQKDLTVLDEKGKPIGVARSEKEALELRDKRTGLETGLTTADKLIGEVQKTGKLVPLWDADKESLRKTYISQLLEAKKAVTGAVNESDERRANEKFNTAWNRGPDAVVKSVNAWKDQIKTDYKASVRSSAVVGGDGNAPTPAASPRSHVETRQINGTTYVRVGGTWKAQN